MEIDTNTKKGGIGNMKSALLVVETYFIWITI